MVFVHSLQHRSRHVPARLRKSAHRALMTSLRPAYSHSILNEQLVVAALLEQRALDDAMSAVIPDMLAGENAPPCCIELLQTGRCKYEKPAHQEPPAFVPERPQLRRRAFNR